MLRTLRARHLLPNLIAKALLGDELPALTRLAARLEPALRQRFEDAVGEIQDAIDLERLAAAIEVGSLNAAEAALELQRFPETFGDLALDLRAGFLAGSSFAIRELATSSIGIAFNVINPYAMQYVAQRLPEIVAPFTTNAREIIRDATMRALNGEQTAMQAARNIRDSIGLYPTQVSAVENFRARLEAEGVNAADVARRVARYTTAQLRYRAEMIARTEIMTAANRGQRAAWRVAVEQGLIRPAEYLRRWLVTLDERLCPQCEPYADKTVDFEAEFLEGDPPLHPHCRCVIELVRAPHVTSSVASDVEPTGTNEVVHDEEGGE